MIKSISFLSLPPQAVKSDRIDDALDEVRQAGFEGLELAIGPKGLIHTDMSEEDCRAVRERIDASGLVVETVASGMSWAFSPTSNDPAVRQRSIQLHADALRRTAWLGCQALLFVPGVVTSPIAPNEFVRYDHAVERARDAATQLLEVAEEVGVDLCIENVWNGLFYSPLEFASFVDSFDSERIGIYFDAGNVLGYHQHPPHWIELLGRRIRRVHIKGFRSNFADGTFAFCDLGEGDVPWPATVDALRQIGYDGTIVAEMLPWKEGLLEHTSAAMDRILGR